MFRHCQRRLAAHVAREICAGALMQLHAWLDWFWDQLSQVSQELLQGGLWPWRMHAFHVP